MAKTERKLAKNKEKLARYEAGIDVDEDDDNSDSSDMTSSDDEDASELD